MRLLILNSTFALVIVGLMGSYPKAAQTESSSNKSNVWDFCTVCAVRARMALNKSPGPTIVPKRDIYLLIEEQDFTLENLKKAFEILSAAYPVPVFLRIVAFSNKEYLQQLIRAEEIDVITDFLDNREGREAQANYYANVYPPRTGYLRSYYVRSACEFSDFRSNFDNRPESPLRKRPHNCIMFAYELTRPVRKIHRRPTDLTYPARRI
jgi:hypothetical protein